MTTHSYEEMMLKGLLVTFEKHKLPRALNIKAKVDKGGLLSDWEVAFLQTAIDEANRAKPLVDRHPELHHAPGESSRPALLLRRDVRAGDAEPGDAGE